MSNTQPVDQQQTIREEHKNLSFRILT